jgi:hypothetical protein
VAGCGCMSRDRGGSGEIHDGDRVLHRGI